ncbi:hypothetical protein KIPB_011599, partial [Kipferlia bialata]|eukprot:g11599.t1
MSESGPASPSSPDSHDHSVGGTLRPFPLALQQVLKGLVTAYVKEEDETKVEDPLLFATEFMVKAYVSIRGDQDEMWGRFRVQFTETMLHTIIRDFVSLYNDDIVATGLIDTRTVRRVAESA